jgi:DNA-binding NarL/FixJ family response regulator
MKTTVALVDDHHLVAQALAGLIRQFDDYEVLFTVENGRQLLTRLAAGEFPDVVLLDLNMPEMDGFATASYLRQHHPAIKILVLSMNDREEHIIRVVREGAKGYLLKDCRPSELRQALDDLRDKGFHSSDFLSRSLLQHIRPNESTTLVPQLAFNARELTFLKLACTDLTYAEIADRMCLSPRTIDGYREALFEKMNVKSRVSMALEAIRWGWVDL